MELNKAWREIEDQHTGQASELAAARDAAAQSLSVEADQPAVPDWDSTEPQLRRPLRTIPDGGAISPVTRTRR
jgi:hypothetical protein